MAIQRVTHVGVAVSDLERSIRFYPRIRLVGEPSDTLLALKGVDAHVAYLERDGFRLELLGFVSPNPEPLEPPRRMNVLGFTHLSLRVTDLDEMTEHLRAEGVRALDSTRIDIASQRIRCRDDHGSRRPLDRARAVAQRPVAAAAGVMAFFSGRGTQS